MARNVSFLSATCLLFAVKTHGYKSLCLVTCSHWFFSFLVSCWQVPNGKSAMQPSPLQSTFLQSGSKQPVLYLKNKRTTSSLLKVKYPSAIFLCSRPKRLGSNYTPLLTMLDHKQPWPHAVLVPCGPDPMQSRTLVDLVQFSISLTTLVPSKTGSQAWTHACPSSLQPGSQKYLVYWSPGLKKPQTTALWLDAARLQEDLVPSSQVSCKSDTMQPGS